MKRLFLLRHAKSSRDDPALADFDRPLAERGIAAAREMGPRLSDVCGFPPVVLCSPALRTRATWEIMAPTVQAKAVLFEPGLYAASWQDLLDRLRQVPPDAERVLLIGHNPGLEELGLFLAESGAGSDLDALRRLRRKFPTCALAAFRSPFAEWHHLSARSCRLEAFLTP